MSKKKIIDLSIASQCKIILHELRDKQRSLTVKLMFEELGIASPPRRICDLIQKGYKIGKTWVYESNCIGIERRVRLYSFLSDRGE